MVIKTMMPGKILHRKTLQTKKIKVFNMFQRHFQTLNMQWSYREEAYDLKQQKDKMLNN